MKTEQAKPGRHKLPPNEKKRFVLSVCLTKEQYMQIKRSADIRGKKMSSYARERLLK